jgi:hypothetical protein
MLWKHHPFGQPLLRSLFSSMEDAGDVQTLAVMSCVLESEARRTDADAFVSSTPDLSQSSSVRHAQSIEPRPFMVARRSSSHTELRRSSTMSHKPDEPQVLPVVFVVYCVQNAFLLWLMCFVKQPVTLPPPVPIAHSVSLTHYQPHSSQRQRFSQHDVIPFVSSDTVPASIPHVHSSGEFEAAKNRSGCDHVPTGARQVKPQPLQISTAFDAQFPKAARLAVVRESDFVVGSLPAAPFAMRTVAQPEPLWTAHSRDRPYSQSQNSPFFNRIFSPKRKPYAGDASEAGDTSPESATGSAVKGLEASLPPPPASPPHSIKHSMLTPIRRSIRYSVSPLADSEAIESVKPPAKEPVKLLPPELEERANMYRHCFLA